MTSVPLHCNICPKRPDFSDISHLLTHIGSKGHLSHYFKAQVRGRQDASVRQQLDTYDRWYTEHQIEKLLSQRMILKDSKKPNGTGRAINKEQRPSIKPVKAPRATKKKIIPTNSQRLPAATNSDNVIDPQLSRSVSTPARPLASPLPSPSSSSPGFDLTTIHRNPLPRMRTFRTPGSTKTATTDYMQQLLAASTADLSTSQRREASDTESDGDHVLRPASPPPSYPEPPSAKDLVYSTKDSPQPATTLPRRRGRPRRTQSWTEDESPAEEQYVPQTPELKGVYYPGMSLFDSASLDAQRKRNQRKNDALVAQIERESLDVECNEYIYWPDGSLKMCRFITGDVQSSAFEEDTPPPPPPKRRRGRKPKVSNPKAGQGKSKSKTEGHNFQDVPTDTVKCTTFIPEHLKYPSRRSCTPDSWFLGQPLSHAHTPEEEEDWLLNMGEPTLKRRRSSAGPFKPGVALPTRFDDPPKVHPESFTAAFGQQAGYRRGDGNKRAPVIGSYVFQESYPGRTGHDIRPPVSEAKLQSPLGAAMNVRNPAFSFAMDDKENLPPAEGLLGGQRHEMGFGFAKSSQRYYTIAGNQIPRVSTNLPPEMAFAGMPTPSVYRMSLNPLNPNAHLRQSLPYSSHYSPVQMPHTGKKPSHATQAASVGQDPEVKEDIDSMVDPEHFMH
ncbi:MAG: hypothetical protein Q9218_001122 [Villophora microphyllina]